MHENEGWGASHNLSNQKSKSWELRLATDALDAGAK
jgi:hypothetical protein